MTVIVPQLTVLLINLQYLYYLDNCLPVSDVHSNFHIHGIQNMLHFFRISPEAENWTKQFKTLKKTRSFFKM